MSKKVLIVEDEETILRLLSTLFGELSDYKILSTSDGEEALQMARSENPDVILLDVQLPKMNGYEVCKSLKSNPTTSHIRVLILSSLPQDRDRRRSKKAGADDYITKPFSPIALVEKVEGLLKGR